MEVSLRDQVVLVHGLRMGLENIKVSLRAKRIAFDAENADLIKGLDERTAELAQAEAVLRAEAVDVFNVTRERKPCPGVEVKDFTEIDYAPATALEWAKAHKMALALDKKAFEGLVKAGALDGVGFVTIAKVPKATIATDLGKALTEGGKP